MGHSGPVASTPQRTDGVGEVGPEEMGARSWHARKPAQSDLHCLLTPRDRLTFIRSAEDADHSAQAVASPGQRLGAGKTLLAAHDAGAANRHRLNCAELTHRVVLD